MATGLWPFLWGVRTQSLVFRLGPKISLLITRSQLLCHRILILTFQSGSKEVWGRWTRLIQATSLHRTIKFIHRTLTLLVGQIYIISAIAVLILIKPIILLSGPLAHLWESMTLGSLVAIPLILQDSRALLLLRIHHSIVHYLWGLFLDCSFWSWISVILNNMRFMTSIRHRHLVIDHIVHFFLVALFVRHVVSQFVAFLLFKVLEFGGLLAVVGTRRTDEYRVFAHLTQFALRG